MIVKRNTYISILSQIIAMKHETEIYDGEPLNFEAIYNRYTKFANQNSSLQSVQRPVIMKAFEHIKVRNTFFSLSSREEKMAKHIYIL